MASAVAAPRWHSCRRWWRRGFTCPYGPESEPPSEEDDDDDDELPPPVGERIPEDDPKKSRTTLKKLKVPEPKAMVDTIKLIPNLVPDVVAQAEADVAKYPDVSSPPHRIPKGNPGAAPDSARAGGRATSRAASKALEAATSSQKVGDPFKTVQNAFGRPGSGSGAPPNSAGADVASGRLAEAALVRSLERSRGRGSARRTEQGRAVEEAERIVRAPKQPKVPVRSNYDYDAISRRQNRAQDRARDLAKRAAVAGLAAAGTAYIIRSFSGGGRGGGFHRQASTFRGGRGDLGFRTAF